MCTRDALQPKLSILRSCFVRHLMSLAALKLRIVVESRVILKRQRALTVKSSFPCFPVLSEAARRCFALPEALRAGLINAVKRPAGRPGGNRLAYKLLSLELALLIV